MIQGCIIFYNDSPALLERCLKSVRGVCDKLLGIDGAFAGFPMFKPWSTDGCLDIAKKYCDTVIETKDPWKSQIDKRNACLTLKNESDYYLIIDSDEYFNGKMPILKSSAYGINIDNPENNTKNEQIRIFRHRHGLKYEERHNWIWHKRTIINQPEFGSKFKKITTASIIHTPGQRPYERRLDDVTYLQKRKEFEGDVMNIMPLIEKKETVTLKFKGVWFSGFQSDSSSLIVKAGDVVSVDPECAKGLLADFPKDWERVK